MTKKVLVTGSAGFIGSSLIHYLHDVTDWKLSEFDVDANDYYNKAHPDFHTNELKHFRYKNLPVLSLKSFLVESALLRNISKYDLIIHLGASAGVEKSFKSPHETIIRNCNSFVSNLFWSTNGETKLLYASSSSVYGNNPIPFKETDACLTPKSLYAATKLFNENAAYAYSSQYGIRTVGMRFFTVYGPWGRPEMALFKFVNHIINGKEISLRKGTARQFTYIDDLCSMIHHMAEYELDPVNQIFIKNNAQVFNICDGDSIPIINAVRTIEEILGKKAKVKEVEIPQFDVPRSYGDNMSFKTFYSYANTPTKFYDGMKKFITWYKENDGDYWYEHGNDSI